MSKALDKGRAKIERKISKAVEQAIRSNYSIGKTNAKKKK